MMDVTIPTMNRYDPMETAGCALVGEAAGKWRQVELVDSFITVIRDGHRRWR